MDKKKVKELIEDATCKLNYFDEEQDNYEGLRMDIVETLEQVVKELYKSDWVSVEEGLPPVDKEVIVLTTGMAIYFGHIVDKRIAKDYNGWNIPNVEYWLPFVDPKDE